MFLILFYETSSADKGKKLSVRSSVIELNTHVNTLLLYRTHTHTHIHTQTHTHTHINTHRRAHAHTHS